MPKKTFRQRLWRCSWECGFKHNNPNKVFSHEAEKHDAIQEARLSEEDAKYFLCYIGANKRIK